MKRFNCTVFDKRGENGDCMEQSKDGRYVTYNAAMHVIDRLQREKKT